MVLTCKQCGKEFELADSEIEFYKKKGLELPKRCKVCRDENQTRKKEQWSDSRKNKEKKTESTIQQDNRKDKKNSSSSENTNKESDAAKKSSVKKNSEKNSEQKTNSSEEKENLSNSKKSSGSQTKKEENDSKSSSMQQSKNSENSSEKSSQTSNNGQGTQPPSGGTRKKGKQLVAAMVFLVLAFVVSRLTGSDPAANGDDTDAIGQTGITVSAAPSGAENLVNSTDKQETPGKESDKEKIPTPAEIEDHQEASPTPTEIEDDTEVSPTIEVDDETPTPTETKDQEISPTPTEIEDDTEVSPTIEVDDKTPTPTETEEQEASPTPAEIEDKEISPTPTGVEILYYFRRDEYLQQHFEKHGDEFDYETAEQYLEGANRVVQDPAALHKLEAEDGDDVYYLEETNEFVIVSKDGYIRTYFKPSRGIDYYNRQ